VPEDQYFPVTPADGLDWLVDAVGLDAEGFFLRNK
jgi:hypothetical protein